MTVESGMLEQLGFEEIEPGIVADTQENRRRAKRILDGWYYEPIFEEDGNPTGLLRLVDPEALANRRKSVHDRRRQILSDPDDPWSDYVGPDDYPIDGDYPYFVRSRLAAWRRDDRQGLDPRDREPFPARCATVRQDGTRCWNWTSQPQKYPHCKNHRGWESEQSQLAALYARNQILRAAPTFAHGLVELAESANSEPVRLKAITEGLDRIGVRGGSELEIKGQVEVTNPADEVRQRLTVLAERLMESDKSPQAELPVSNTETPSDIVEAEVVSNTETPEPEVHHRD